MIGETFNEINTNEKYSLSYSDKKDCAFVLISEKTNKKHYAFRLKYNNKVIIQGQNTNKNILLLHKECIITN